jgi:hypothetical protein
MLAAAAKKLSVRLQAVDSNGLLPLRAAEKEFPTAFSSESMRKRAWRRRISRCCSGSNVRKGAQIMLFLLSVWTRYGHAAKIWRVGKPVAGDAASR